MDKQPKLTQYKFPSNQYIQEEHPKKQIYLHHTAGGPNPYNVFKGWESNSERIGTCVVIGGLPDKTNSYVEGEIVQGFSSKFNGYHLGLKEQTFESFGISYQSLDKISIGIEICNWGQLVLGGDGKFRNYVNGIVPEDQVCRLSEPFKGYTFFHKYTDAQIESVKYLLLLWKEKYGIPITYNEDIWNVTPRALKGELGVFAHVSVRRDKCDIAPQPAMIEMLKSLT